MSAIDRAKLRGANMVLRQYEAWLQGYVANQTDDVNRAELWCFYRLIRNARLHLEAEVLNNQMIDREKL